MTKRVADQPNGLGRGDLIVPLIIRERVYWQLQMDILRRYPSNATRSAGKVKMNGLGSV